MISKYNNLQKKNIFNFSKKKEKEKITKISDKILITYVYFETGTSINNLIFFLKNGVFENKKIKYNFIIKGSNISVKFPNYSNIEIINVKNIGRDFYGYSYSISITNINQFKYFIFLNDTVVGPFIPRYLEKEKWYQYFTNLISNKVKLVGCTINKMHNNEHVQGMAFTTDLVGLNILIKDNIFNISRTLNYDDKVSYINDFEIGMSRAILEAGYGIDCFSQVENSKNQVYYEDIHYNNKYFGSTLNPLEIMFIKSNRIQSELLSSYILWNS